MWCHICGAIYVVQLILTNLKLSSPMLAQTSHPPTRNLSGKTHDAGGVGATDDGVGDGIRDGGNCVIGSAMKLSMTTMQAHFDNDCDDGAVGYSGSDDEDDDGAAIAEPMLATTSTMMMSIRR